MKLKDKGTSIPTLERSKSLIDENVTEKLIAQAFDVIFRELNRYTAVFKKFKGIDWYTYVQTRNKEIKEGTDPERYPDELLFDEDEEEEKA
mmetsp:Transcript_26656/g.19022  ORF Transcript_26656/g.19022 Transcript_26656/m.19022 type:complete len:91 (+) Transcript_26656:2662-2934(+)